MPKFITVIIVVVLIFLSFYVYKTYLDFKDTSKRIDIPTIKETKDIPQISTLATGLEVPWALVFLPASQGGPDGGILATERVGRVRLIDSDSKLQPKPVVTLSNVKQTGESGLHGIAIHPDFEKNHYVYLYYTYSTNGDNALNKVSRFILSSDTLTDEKIIVDKIPGAIFHDGGRIKFGPDGALYITTGDALNPSLSQNKNSLAGKILKVMDDKNIQVYSYGHRNPQGIAWDDKGRLWETEHGQTAQDELNLIEPNKNYGWPTIRGDQKQEGMVSPILQSGSDTWAPAGAAFYRGSIFFGGLRGQALYEVELDSLNLKEHFKGQFGRIRDVVLGPDNMLYITTSNRDGRGSPTPDDDKIIRINPEKL